MIIAALCVFALYHVALDAQPCSLQPPTRREQLLARVASAGLLSPGNNDGYADHDQQRRYHALGGKPFACRGLITAIERFDPAKSRKLSTYDTWWIHQAIGRVIAEEGRVIGP